MGIPADFRNGAYAILAGVSGLAQVHRARPASPESLPCAWVDDVRLSITHDAGVRQWSGELDVALITGGWDNEEAEVAADALVSTIIDAFSDAPHMAGANTVSEPSRTRLVPVDLGNGVTMPAWVVTVGRFVFAEGR